MHNSEAAARRAVARRAGILDTEVDTVAGQAAENRLPVRPKFSESLVGHPGLEPGANGLRTQRRTGHKALFVSDSDTPAPAIAVTKGHHATYSGHRDRLDRAGLLHAIARARKGKVMTEDQALALVVLVEQFGGRWR